VTDTPAQDHDDVLHPAIVGVLRERFRDWPQVRELCDSHERLRALLIRKAEALPQVGENSDPRD
jgi:hypothetical protein